jgi:hypothetical protein
MIGLRLRAPLAAFSQVALIAFLPALALVSACAPVAKQKAPVGVAGGPRDANEVVTDKTDYTRCQSSPAAQPTVYGDWKGAGIARDGTANEITLTISESSIRFVNRCSKGTVATTAQLEVAAVVSGSTLRVLGSGHNQAQQGSVACAVAATASNYPFVFKGDCLTLGSGKTQKTYVRSR